MDHGNICWNAPTVYFFVQNSCATPITVDIKVQQKCRSSRLQTFQMKPTVDVHTVAVLSSRMQECT